MFESQNIEFKESWRDEYLKWICGFANAQGGKLFIGKNDNGEVIGVKESENLAIEIPNKVRDMLGILVDVNLLEEAGKKYLEIIIEPYPYPVNYKGQYHYRSGSTKQEFKGNALNKFILQKAGKHWDSVTLPHLKPEELDATAFDLFKRKEAKSKRVEPETMNESSELLLNHLHLTDNGQLKRAAALLFHNDPEKFITGAFVKIGYFENESDLLFQNEIHGNLFEQVDTTIDLLLTKYLKANISYEGITRIETLPYPEDALREAIINAIAHKEYSSGTPVQIKVYRNRLSIWNDGQLPQGWSLENLRSPHPSKPNNPDLANCFFRAGLIESWGRGINKMITLCIESGIPEPEFKTDFGGIQIIFMALQKSVVKTTEKSIEKSIEKTEDKIIQLIRNNNRITINQLAKILNLTPGAINKQIASLKQKKLIQRDGPDKGGSWKIPGNPEV
jgi:ATP-dependent DNA helicase RecG